MDMVIIALIWMGILIALGLLGVAYIKIEEYIVAKKKGKKKNENEIR